VKKLLFVFVLITVSAGYAQYKDTGIEPPSMKEGIVSENPNALFGFLNSDDFIMRHSFSLNYSSFSGQGVSMTSTRTV